MSRGIFIEGVKRSGKTKYAVDEIKPYLDSGRKVATNLDLNHELMSPNSKSQILRMPDHPRYEDLEAIGYGYPELEESEDNYDESKNGIVVIDELLTHLNSRSFRDKDRLKIVSWFVQMGKYGWDLILIGQDYEAIDSQLRTTVINQLINCKSGRNYFGFGFVNSMVTLAFDLMKIPKFHVARFYDGTSKGRKAHGYQFYIKEWTHQWYKTAQKFVPDNLVTKRGELIDMRSTYSMIPAATLNSWQNTKVNTVTDNQSNSKPQQANHPDNKPLLNKFQKIGLFLMAGFLVYKFGYSADIETPVENVTTALKENRFAPEAKEPTQQQPNDKQNELFKDVYITCSVYNNHTKSTSYCFEKAGRPFHPSDIDMFVLPDSKCRAKLLFEGNQYIVRCNPFYVPSSTGAYDDTPNNSDEIELAGNL